MFDFFSTIPLGRIDINNLTVLHIRKLIFRIINRMDLGCKWRSQDF